MIGDFSGAPGVVGEGIQLAALNARYVVVGSTGGSEQPITTYKILLKNLRIFGSYSAEIGAYHKAMDFMARTRDRYDWDRMVGNTYGLADANVALSRMLRMEDIKAVIEPVRLSGLGRPRSPERVEEAVDARLARDADAGARVPQRTPSGSMSAKASTISFRATAGSEMTLPCAGAIQRGGYRAKASTSSMMLWQST